MVSHESVPGHGHVARHGWRPLGLYMMGDHHCRHCLGEKRKQFVASGFAHWTLAIGICWLTLHPNFFEHVFCFACLCWALASGHCVALVIRTSTVQLGIGKGSRHWYVFVAWPQ